MKRIHETNDLQQPIGYDPVLVGLAGGDSCCDDDCCDDDDCCSGTGGGCC